MSDSSTEELAAFFSLSRDLLCIVGLDGYFKRVNPSFARVLGYSDAELLNHPYVEFIHPEDRPGTGAKAVDLFRASGDSNFENRYLSKDGSIRHLSWRSTPFGDRALAIARDVTEIRERENREKAEVAKSLRDAQESFGHLLEAIPQIVWKSDASGAQSYLNERWYEYTGVSPEEVKQGVAWEKAIHPADFLRSIERWRECLSSGECFEMEYRIRNARDGIYRWHLARAVPILDASGKIYMWFGTLTDIDSQKRIEGELRSSLEELNRTSRERTKLIASERAALESSRLKSEFLATMSHEIRTPLNGVVGMCALLLEGRLNPRQRDIAETIVYSAESLSAIVNDILDFSKIEAGKMELEKAEFDLEKLVQGVVSAMRFEATAKGLSLDAKVDCETDRLLLGDALRVRQVLYNLVQNAVKFTNSGGISISVRVGTPRCDQGWVARFEVSDTGIGMSKEVMAQVFKPFVQGDPSTTRRYGGTGLGLSICRRLVEMMKGEIGFASQVEKGTRFWFEVPFEAGRSLKATDNGPNSSEAFRSRRVLVAEDHPTNQKVIRYLLEGVGMKVDLVSSGREAMAVFKRKRYDAILMDCHMPHVDGYEATRKIREIEGSVRKRVPIFALTADVLRGTPEKCLSVGMDGYIQKPIDRTRLLSALSSVMSPKKRSLPAGTRSNQVLESAALEKLNALNAPGMSDLVAELIEDFLRDTPQRLAQIERYVRERTYARVESEAHALKSVAATLGAREFAKVCRSIESAGRNRRAKRLEALLIDMGKNYEKAAKELRERRSSAA